MFILPFDIISIIQCLIHRDILIILFQEFTKRNPKDTHLSVTTRPLANKSQSFQIQSCCMDIAKGVCGDRFQDYAIPSFTQFCRWILRSQKYEKTGVAFPAFSPLQPNLMPAVNRQPGDRGGDSPSMSIFTCVHNDFVGNNLCEKNFLWNLPVW